MVKMSQHDGGIPALITGSRISLFKGGIVFFVNDHQTQLRKWQKNRRTGSQDDVITAGSDA